MGNVRNKETKRERESKGEREREKERETKIQTLNYREQTEGYHRGGAGWGQDG